MSDPKPQLTADLTESVRVEATEKRFEVEPQVADRTRQTDPASNMQASMIENTDGHKIDLGESLVHSPEEGSGSDEIKEERKQVFPPPMQIAADFFYPPDHSETVLEDSPATGKIAPLHECFGFDSYKRYNVELLDKDSIIYASGITYTIFNYFIQERRVFFSKDGGGIGSIAVHPSRKYFAVAEKGNWPNIYIYEYPSMKLYRVLRKGTERSYSNICFSQNGNYIASVGSSPDYLLCVWEWQQEIVILKSKAFSQEVYKVSFNRFNEKALTTSGMGHIKFWKIAETFTGLKLQGEIAKFGQIELSDVTAFVDFEDGKVLSTSEYGRLLLWEGNLIKSVIGMDAENGCHNGAIEVLILKEQLIISAGVDGYIRFWDYPTINQSESDEAFNFFLKPTREIYLEREPGVPAHINCIIEYDTFWMVQDAKGKIWKLKVQDGSKECVLETNAGKFNDVAASPINNCVVTAGADGYVRLWDYGNKRQFCARNFKTPSEATCIEWIPYNKRNAGRMLAVAFSDGIIRLIVINQNELTLIKAEKILKRRIVLMKCSPDGATLSVIDEGGDLFFVSLSASDLQDMKPYCLHETGFKANDMCWDRDSKKILLACKDGRIHEITVPKPADCDISETYLKPFQARSHLVKMMESQKPKKEDLQLELLLKRTKGGSVDEKIVDQQWQPSPVLNVVYYDKECTKVLCSVDGKFLGLLYIIDMSKERPTASIPVTKEPTCYLAFEDQELLVMGFINGSFQLRHKFSYNQFMRKNCHDKDYGKVRKVCFNYERNAVISVGEDGMMFVHKLDYQSLVKSAKLGEPVTVEAITVPSTILGVNQVSFIEGIELNQPTEQDVEDGKMYSIQERKLKAEEDNKMSVADRRKLEKRNKIKELQQIFKEVLNVNRGQEDELAKLSQEELVVDPEYLQILQHQVQDELEETRKELKYDEAYSGLLQEKIQKYMIDELLFDKFSVRGLKNQQLVVCSFKLKRMSDYMLAELDKIEAILHQEQINTTREHSVEPSMSNTRTDMRQTNMSAAKKKDEKDVHNKIREAEAEFEKELAYAHATKGDYKLKTSKNYIVPESERMNISRKKKHMFINYQFLFESKKKFNERLLELKQRREQLVDKIKRYNKVYQDINAELGIEEQLFQPRTKHNDEEEITEEDIDEYAKQKAREKEQKKGGMGMGGMGGMGGSNAVEVKEEKKERKKSIRQEKPIEKDKPQIKARKGMKTYSSPLEQEVREINQIRLRSEKSKMQAELDQEIGEFEKELHELKQTKNYLEMDLRLVEMKLITYFQEFIVFRDMEDEDNKLLDSLSTLNRDKENFEELHGRLTGQIEQLDGVTEELRRKLDEDKKIFKELVFPDDEEKRDKILKYYKNREKKRLSKAKKQVEKPAQDQEEGSQDSQEEEEESSVEEDDEYDEDEEKPDITPIETDHKNYDLIRRICEHDEKIDENTKQRNELEKQKHQATNKIKNILFEVDKIKDKLAKTQLAKLEKSNKLDVSYPVRLSQIENLVKVGATYALPDDLNSAILFTSTQFERLSNRIRELQKEKQDIAAKQQQLEKQLARLRNQVSKASIDIENKKKDYQEKQLLKFGDIIDLKILDALEPTRQVIEMRERYKLEEREASKRVEQVKHQLQLKKKELLENKRENTRIITEITELGERQMDLNKKLDSTNKQLFRADDEDKKNDLDKEKQNLLDLIKFLSKEIDDLKTEIGLFKRKGGHIYTMVTSNKRNTFL